MGQVPLYAASPESLASVKTIVLTAACPEGLGFHSVMGPGTLFKLRGRSTTGGREREAGKVKRIVVSPNLNKYDVRAQFGEEVVFCRTWEQARALLEADHGPQARVCVFPCGAIQYGGE
jgi:hypothetical protein